MMNKKSNINERILHLIDNQSNGNKKKFAEKIGYKPQVISNIVSGRKTNPSYEVLYSILSTFVDVSADWLIIGEGKMLRDNKPQTTFVDEKDQYIIELQKDKIKVLEEEVKRLKKDNSSNYHYSTAAEPTEKLKKK